MADINYVVFVAGLPGAISERKEMSDILTGVEPMVKSMLNTIYDRNPAIDGVNKVTYGCMFAFIKSIYLTELGELNADTINYITRSMTELFKDTPYATYVGTTTRNMEQCYKIYATHTRPHDILKNNRIRDEAAYIEKQEMTVLNYMYARFLLNVCTSLSDVVELVDVMDKLTIFLNSCSPDDADKYTAFISDVF
jgi:hypothetical protein